MSFDPEQVEHLDWSDCDVIANLDSLIEFVRASDYDALLADYKALDRQNEQLLEALHRR